MRKGKRHRAKQRRGQSKRRPGRPEVPAALRKGSRVLLNLRPEERAALLRVAASRGESASAYVRRVLVKHLTRAGEL